MLTIKLITENTDAVIRGLEKKHFKGAKESIDKVLELNDKRRIAQNHLNKLTYDEQLKEMSDSKTKLENITGKKVTSIAFPFGDYNEYSVKAAKNAGYNIAFTTNKGFADRDGSGCRGAAELTLYDPERTL